MSDTPFTIVSGVMPCSSLYATWTARRRRLLHCTDDRLGALVRVQDDLPCRVAGGTTCGLDERRLAAQESLLVGVEHRDERDLRQVEALAQEVHADEDVELAEPELADDRDPVERVDLVEIARANAGLEQVVGEVAGHLLGQRRDEDALARLLPMPDLVQEVVDLVARRAQLHLRVDDAGRADELLGNDLGARARTGLVSRRRTRAASPSRETRRSGAAGCRARTGGGTRSR